jgi:hypothetical protein
VSIAESGYGQFQYAFFPLYPALISILREVFFGNTLFTAVSLSVLCIFAAYNLFQVILKELESKRTVLTFGGRCVSFYESTVYLLAFPTSFFFVSGYTESLFLFLFLGYLYGLLRKSMWLTIVTGLLLGLTRFVGAFACVLPLVKLVLNQKKSSAQDHRYLTSAIFAPLSGWALYALYLWLQTGNTFEFVSAQRGFNNSRSTSIILLPQVLWRYVKIIATAQWNHLYWVALVELGIFLFVFGACLVFLWKTLKHRHDAHRLLLIGVGAFSLINLILPTLTGTLSSIPRYAIMSISMFLVLPTITSRFLKGLVIIVSIALQIVLGTHFLQGWFVS